MVRQNFPTEVFNCIFGHDSDVGTVLLYWIITLCLWWGLFIWIASLMMTWHDILTLSFRLIWSMLRVVFEAFRPKLKAKRCPTCTFMFTWQSISMRCLIWNEIPRPLGKGSTGWSQCLRNETCWEWLFLDIIRRTSETQSNENMSQPNMKKENYFLILMSDTCSVTVFLEPFRDR